MSIEIKKPTTFTEGALALWTNESNAYDQSGTGGDETTYAYQSLDTDESPSIRFHTWQAKVETYTATVLKLKWETSIQTGDDEVHIEYTKNGGGAWADLLAKAANRSVGFSTAQISLDANQDLTQVEVRVSSDKLKGGDGVEFMVSDIWTEGEYTGGTEYQRAVDGSFPAQSGALNRKAAFERDTEGAMPGQSGYLERKASFLRSAEGDIDWTPGLTRKADFKRPIEGDI